MNRNQLLKKLSKPVSKKQAVDLAMVRDCVASDLIAFSLYPLNELAFRSSWVLEQMFYYRKDSFLLSVEDFLNAYYIQENKSCQRHFTKIMMALTKDESGQVSIAGIHENRDKIVEITFDWLINPDTPVAVKGNCMDILLNLSYRHTWITDELRFQIHFLLKDGSAAIQSRGKRILKKLKC